MTETVVAVIRAKLNLPDVSAFVSAFAPLISPGGMFVRTRQIKEPGTVIRFDFSLASGERLLLGEGIVRQVRDGSDGSPAGMLIKFTKLNRASKDLVDQIVEHKGSYSQPQVDGHRDDLYGDEGDEIPASNAAQTPEPEPESEPEPPPAETPRPAFVEPLQRSSPARVAPSSSSGRILSTVDVLSALRDAPPDDDVPTVGLPLNAPAHSKQPSGLGFLGLDESEVDDVLGNLFGDSQDQGFGFGSPPVANLDAPPSIAIVGASFLFAAPKDTPAEIASTRFTPPSDESSPPDKAPEDLFLAEESEDDGHFEDNDDPYSHAEPYALPVAAPVEPAPEEDDLDDEGPYHPGDQLPDQASAFDDPYPVDQPPSFDDDEDDAPPDSPPFDLSEGDDLDDEVVEPDEDIIEDSLDSFDDDIVEADIVEADIVDSEDDELVEAGGEFFDAGDDDDAPFAFADEPEANSDDDPLEVDAPAEKGDEDAIRIHRGAAGFVLMDDDVSIDADERDRQIFSGNLEEALAAEREANEDQSSRIHPSRRTMQWQTGVIHDANQPGEDEEDEEDEEDYSPPQLSEDMGIDVDLVDEPLKGEHGEPDDAEDDEHGEPDDAEEDDAEEDEADRGRGGVFFFGEGGAPDLGDPLEVDVDLDGFAPEDDDSEDGFDLDDDEARAHESLETQQPNRVLGRIQLKRRTVSSPPDPLGPDDDPVIPDFADDDEDEEAALTTGEILTLQSANIESDSGRAARTGSESLDFFLDDEDDAPRAPRPFSSVVPSYKPESTERIPSITGMSELGGLLDEIQGRGDDRPPMSASALHLATGTALGAEMERDEDTGEDGEIPSLAGLVSAAHQELDDRDDDEVANDSILDQVLGGDGPRIVPPNRNFDVPSSAESNLLAGKKKKGFFSRLFGSDD